jgi:hypothetical protein
MLGVYAALLELPKGKKSAAFTKAPFSNMKLQLGGMEHHHLAYCRHSCFPPFPTQLQNK